MFEPITRNIFRWGTIDGETGIMMYSHLLLRENKAVLIDPLAMPEIIKMIRILGDPVAVIMTTYPHLRGCSLLSRQMGIPLFIPDIKAIDEDEAITKMFIDLYSMKEARQYDESTSLPLDIKAHIIPGRHEMALKFDDFLIVGDSAYGLNGKLTFSAALKPIIKKTSANGLLSGHIEDIPSGLQDML
jgi:hypothetical protein